MTSPTARTYLFISQVFVPDPAAVGQYIADAARMLASRGHRVIVLTSRRGYDDPSRRYPAREVMDGVEVIRLGFSSFGKRRMWIRLLGGIAFLALATLRALFIPRLTAVVVTTSPPMGALAGIILRAVRGVPFKYWLMDLNPDQVVAMGAMAPDAPLVRLLESLNRAILAQASDIVVLDRFMEDRVRRKAEAKARLHVLPPWPLEGIGAPIPHESNAWREALGVGDAIVVMYSGNHSPANPLTTLLAAARRVVDEPRLRFVFVGGGSGKGEVESAGLPNIVSLPYQPIEHLRQSLSAGDVHVVTMGDDVVGIVHPCKIYGAMAVARPVVSFGPAPSHLSDLIQQGAFGWAVSHGDVDGAERLLRQIAEEGRTALTAMGSRGHAMVQATLNRTALAAAFCDIVELA